MRRMLFFVIVLSIGWAAAAAANEPVDKFGKPDKVTVEIAPMKAKGQWAVGVYLENDEQLAAITVPLRFGERVGQFKLDSVLFQDTRVSYFALKTTNSYDTLNSVLIGLLYSLGDQRPPLEPGFGPVAWLFFTQTEKPGGPGGPPVIDSTFFVPFNTLELVTPSAEPIKPIFETIQVKTLTKFKKPEAKAPSIPAGETP